MQKMIKTYGKWTGTAVLVLFILVTVTLGLAAGLTYAGRSESPDQVLTYSKGQLVWDSSMHIDPKTGEYELPLFEGMREGEDGEKIIAPGDGDMKIVRLSNQAKGAVTYTAVVYLESSAEIPIEGGFANFGEGAQTEDYLLPEEAEDAVVLEAVSGELESGRMKDFDVQWSWAYEQEDVASGDAADTQLGTDGASAKLGVYIVVVREDVNVDTNGDDIPDINVDTDGDGEYDLNIDTDGDGIPDLNIDTDGDGIADLNIDTDGDGIADLNIDTDGDGIADRNIDADGDGIVDAVALPRAPETGDESKAGMYAGLLVVCILILSVMIYERRRNGRCSG